MIKKIDKASEQSCLNCSAQLLDNAIYCQSCGQKNTNGKIRIREFVGEFFDSVFNFNSQFYRTLLHLFIPGRLTKEYFRGRHKSYAHPLRIFFLIAVFHLSIIGIITLQNIPGLDKSPLSQMQTQQEKQQVYNLIEQFVAEHPDYFTAPVSKSAIDSLSSFVYTKANIRIDTSSSVFIGSFDRDSMKITQLAIRMHDMGSMSYEELLEKYEIDDLITKMFLKQQIKSLTNPKALLQSLIGNLVWMLFILLPALALIMKLLYFRRNYYFIEHLVFQYHWHSFAFIPMSVYFLLMTRISPLWLVFTFFIILLFGFIAMRSYYGQGIIKTGIKYGILLISYGSLLIFLMGITSLISLMVF